MGKNSLDEILITPLSRISVKGGDVFHALKSHDIGYQGFGEAYFSSINFGTIKAWKRHKKMIMNLIVPVGNVRFVFTDLSGNFMSHEIGEHHYARITVPPNIWFGFKGLDSKVSSLVLNVSSIPHDPDEVERNDVDSILFNWD